MKASALRELPGWAEARALARECPLGAGLDSWVWKAVDSIAAAQVAGAIRRTIESTEVLCLAIWVRDVLDRPNARGVRADVASWLAAAKNTTGQRDRPGAS